MMKINDKYSCINVTNLFLKGIPYSLRESGFIFGIILLFLVAYVTGNNIILSLLYDYQCAL